MFMRRVNIFHLLMRSHLLCTDFLLYWTDVVLLSIAFVGTIIMTRGALLVCISNALE